MLLFFSSTERIVRQTYETTHLMCWQRHVTQHIICCCYFEKYMHWCGVSNTIFIYAAAMWNMFSLICCFEAAAVVTSSLTLLFGFCVCGSLMPRWTSCHHLLSSGATAMQQPCTLHTESICEYESELLQCVYWSTALLHSFTVHSVDNRCKINN